ncbi:unnamed protein product [Thlaspi arvense]|uniref:FKB95-like N-terminal Kelch domain-containing protein n=1 Tax=Thlaspi arvense TaxID=13288 RepID=A0AAU9SQ16_THLAR|nr:unnamed protein product [Thlaspi arvense]
MHSTCRVVEVMRCWRVVKGLEELLAKTTKSWLRKIFYYGEKLALFFHKSGDKTIDNWCAEIVLERRQEGEIWRKVQWCDVLIDDGFYRMEQCLAVTV